MPTENDIKGKEESGKEGAHGSMVTITINSVPVLIHRGHHTVPEIKTVAGIPLADDLDQVVDGKLVPLADDGTLTIKGGERFVSHPKDGSSS